MVKGTVLERTEKKIPEDPETRLEGFLATFNTELKDAIVLSLDRSPRTKNEIQTQYKKKVRHFTNESSNVWVPGVNTFGLACHQTLVPIGLVAEEKVQKDGTNRIVRSWSLSDIGESLGTYMAKFALKTAIDFNTSLFPILGATQVAKDENGKFFTRAPYSRIQILKSLAEGEKRVADLEVSIDGNMTYHLPVLRKAGLIEYESVNTESRGWAVKSFVSDELKGSYGSYSEEIVRAFIEAFVEGPCDYHEARERAKRKDVEVAEQTARTLVSYLERNGNIKSVDFKGTEKQSSARITERGYEFLERFTVPFEEAALTLNPNPVRVADWDDELIRSGVMLYYPHSKAETDSLHDHEIKARQIYDYLVSQEPGRRGIRPIEYAKRSGIRKETANTILPRLVDAGLWIRERVGHAAFYRPKQHEEI